MRARSRRDRSLQNMDSRRFSAISHGDMRFWNPLPAGELVNLLRELRLPKGARVLDYGCGNARYRWSSRGGTALTSPA